MTKPLRHRRSLVGRLVTEYTMPILRVSLFGAVVLLGVVGVLAHQARAQLGEMLMGIGVEMLRFQGAERQQAPRTLMINGQPLRISVGVASAPLDEVLDHYQSGCRERGGSLAQEVQELRDSGEALSEVDNAWLDPVIRQQGEDRGIVACMDTGPESQSTEGLASKIAEFGQQMDLSAIGDLRYIYAVQEENETVFVVIWTEGSFRVGEMFPSEGDAPGADPQGLPRPPESRRLLSAYEVDHPQSMTLYAESSWSAEDMSAHMLAALQEDGWNPLETDAPTERAMQMTVLERGDNMITLSIVETPTAGTQTSLLVAR